jgi:hypothetical protein
MSIDATSESGKMDRLVLEYLAQPEVGEPDQTLSRPFAIRCPNHPSSAFSRTSAASRNEPKKVLIQPCTTAI